jgi:hypothetical protein
MARAKFSGSLKQYSTWYKHKVVYLRYALGLEPTSVAAPPSLFFQHRWSVAKTTERDENWGRGTISLPLFQYTHTVLTVWCRYRYHMTVPVVPAFPDHVANTKGEPREATTR